MGKATGSAVTSLLFTEIIDRLNGKHSLHGIKKIINTVKIGWLATAVLLMFSS